MAWSIWQLVDSALPTGSFAHSSGLESAIKHGVVSDSASLELFGRRVVTQASWSMIPFVEAGFAASEARRGLGANDCCGAEELCAAQVDAWARSDRLCHATINNHVALHASISTGNALLRVVASAFPEAELMLKILRKRKRIDSMLHGHHAPLFGFVCGLIRWPVKRGGTLVGVDMATVGRMFLFTILRDLVSAAMRLGVVGPFEASALERRLSEESEGALHEVQRVRPAQVIACSGHAQKRRRICTATKLGNFDEVNRTVTQGGDGTGLVVHTTPTPSGDVVASDAAPMVWQTDPVLDLIQASHGLLYSRLFVS